MASGRMEFHARSIMQHANFTFVLPNDVEMEEVFDKKYYDRDPMNLILLHGLTGTDTDWLYGGVAQEMAIQYNMNIFMPTTGNSFYLDRGYTGANYSEFVGEELRFEIVRDFRLKRAGIVNPILQEIARLFDFNKEMLRFAQFRRRSGEHAFRIDEFRRRIDGAAPLAAIPILLLLTALRTGAANKTVGEKTPGNRIVKLLDFAFGNQIGFSNLFPNEITEALGLRRVRTPVVVERDIKSAEIFQVSFFDLGDKLFFGNSLLIRGNRNRGAVRVVGAKITAILAAKLLKTHPNVRLNVLDKVPNVNIAVRIRERAGY